jgi:hypothetical protein
MMINLNRFLTIVSVSIFLAACGGGDTVIVDGDEVPNSLVSQPQPTPAPPPLRAPKPDLGMTMDASSIQVDELSERNINLTFSGVQGEAFLTIRVITFLNIGTNVTLSTTNITNSGGVLTIALSEINRMGSMSYDLTLTDSEGRQVTKNIDIIGINTSGVAVVAEFDTLHSNMVSFMPLYDERDVFERLTRLLSMINIEDSSASIEFFPVIDEIINRQIFHRSLDYEDMLRRYSIGHIPEELLIEYMAQTKAILRVHVESANSAINSLSMASNGLVPNIPLKDVYVADGYNMLSQFIGNPSLGQYDENGAWVFADIYAFLEDIALPSVETCNVE